MVHGDVFVRCVRYLLVDQRTLFHGWTADTSDGRSEATTKLDVWQVVYDHRCAWVGSMRRNLIHVVALSLLLRLSWLP